MISVIIPVFNCEKYLSECLESVVNQTYKALQISLIDDGSTDSSGSICDDFAAKDSRITVFHTENQGVSAARNIGIDKAFEAGSEYLAFVDADDWLELNMYEELYSEAQRTGADIVSCGYYLDYSNKRTEQKVEPKIYNRSEALIALARNVFPSMPWGKIYAINCFSNTRFTVGMTYEDIMIMHKLFNNSSCVILCDKLLYHYRQLQGSIVHSHPLCNLYAKWLARIDRLNFYKALPEWEEVQSDLLYKCAMITAHVWKWIYSNTKEERAIYKSRIGEISAFSKSHFRLLGEKKWNAQMRFFTFLSHFNNNFSYAFAYFSYKVYCKIRPGAKLYE